MTSEKIPVPMEEEGGVWDESTAEKVRKATMEVFAMDESASVQVSEECLIGTWTENEVGNVVQDGATGAC